MRDRRFIAFSGLEVKKDGARDEMANRRGGERHCSG